MASKVCCKSALGTLPKHRITAHRWLTKHNRMVGTLWTIWCLPETVRRALPQYALEIMEASGEWLTILRQGFQLEILQFKLRVLRYKQRKLLRENAKLRRLQINHVLL